MELKYVLQQRTTDVTPAKYQGWRDISDSHSKKAIDALVLKHNSEVEPGHEDTHRASIQIR